MPLRRSPRRRSDAIKVALGAVIVLPALLACAGVPVTAGGYPEASVRTEVMVRTSTNERSHRTNAQGEAPSPAPAGVIEERLKGTDGGALIDDLSFDSAAARPSRDRGGRR